MDSKSKPHIIIAKTEEHLASICADFFYRTTVEHLTQSGRFSVALSGGSTPRPMHKLLAMPPYLTDVPWKQIDIYWADERLVPPNDPASNYGAAKKDLLDHLPIQKDHIHPMCSSHSPGRAAEEYESLLTEYFELETNALPLFDLIFLGIGQDGHTASIFPNDPTAIDTGRWVVPVKGGTPDVHRLTLTMPVLLKARHLLFLVTGRSKAEMIRTIFEQDSAGLPPQHLNASGNQVFWFLDQEAASLLKMNLAGQEK